MNITVKFRDTGEYKVRDNREDKSNSRKFYNLLQLFSFNSLQFKVIGTTAFQTAGN